MAWKCRLANPHQMPTIISLATLLVAASVQAIAQVDYPRQQPVRLVVGLPAGSFIDLVGRWVTDEIRKALGGTFVVENRPGGATNLATGVVARAPNDGYTLLLATSANTLNESLFTNLPFDLRKDFDPVAMIASTPWLVLVNDTVPAQTLLEMVAYARANPGKISVGSLGTGSPNLFAVETLAKRTGIDVVPVFYRSSAEAVNDLLGARISMALSPLAVALPHVTAGKLRALAITSLGRSLLAPDIPTVAEAANLPGYDVSFWTGVFAPAGTSPEIVERLSQVIVKSVSAEPLKSTILNSGAEPRPMASKEFREFVRKDIDDWAEAVRASPAKREK